MSAAGGQTPNARAVSVLLVEDDAIVREWFRLALEGTEFRFAGSASTAASARELLPRRVPDLLVVDYRLGDTVGTELVRELRRQGVTTPAIVFTANPETGLNEAARESGAQGTALKTGRQEELLAVLRAVTRGEQSFDARHPRRPPGRAALSVREREVLRLVAQGSTNRDVAEALGIGEETVKTILQRAFAKLGATRRAEAVAVAQSEGLL